MKLSNVALAAIIFVAGTAVGIATGTAVGIATGPQVAPDSTQGERLASVENAAVVENLDIVSSSDPKSEPAVEKLLADLQSDQNEIVAQFEELKSRHEKAAQREAELDTQSEQLEKKLASLEVLEEELALVQENLRNDGKALEDRRAQLKKQEEIFAAQLQSVLERENQLVALEQKLATQRAAFRAKEQAEIATSKPDLIGNQSVSETAVTEKLSGVELSAATPQEPARVDLSREESSQAEALSQTSATENDATPASNAPITEVHFEKNSATLTPGALKRAREAASRLQNKNFSKITIAGHTDTTGSPTRNQALSNQRAEAVAEVLVQAGLSRQSIEIVGFGETYAMLPISTADGVSEPLNRCVGIFVE